MSDDMNNMPGMTNNTTMSGMTGMDGMGTMVGMGTYDNNTLAGIFIGFFIGLLLIILLPPLFYYIVLSPSKQPSKSISNPISYLFVLLHFLVINLPRMSWVTLLVIVFIWVMQAEGQFGFNEVSVFGWHAVLMTVAAPILLTESITLFQSPSIIPTSTISRRKSMVYRIMHVCIHICAFICAILGLIAIGYYKMWSGSPIAFPFFTLFTPHSWLGIVLCCLWTMQFLARCIASRISVTSWLFLMIQSVHHNMGYLIWGLSLATCALGFQDMQSSDLAGDGYPYNSELSFYSCAGAIMLMLIALTTVLVPSFSSMLKRAFGIQTKKGFDNILNPNVV